MDSGKRAKKRFSHSSQRSPVQNSPDFHEKFPCFIILNMFNSVKKLPMFTFPGDFPIVGHLKKSPRKSLKPPILLAVCASETVTSCPSKSKRKNRSFDLDSTNKWLGNVKLSMVQLWFNCGSTMVQPPSTNHKWFNYGKKHEKLSFWPS